MKKLSTLAKKKLVISALEDIKARDIQAIDVRKVTDIFDWIVVASAESARQTKALSRHVRDRLKEAGSSIVGTEGEETGDWILVDAGDVVAHVMQPAVRQHYALEELYGEGKFDDVVNSTAPVARGREAPAQNNGREAPAQNNGRGAPAQNKQTRRRAHVDEGADEEAPKPRTRKKAATRAKRAPAKRAPAKRAAAKKPRRKA